MGLNPKAACQHCFYFLSPLLLCMKDLEWRGNVIPPPFSHMSTPFFRLSTWPPPKKTPHTTSGFQFPASYGPHAVSNRVLGAWHRTQHFQRDLIINMQILTELSDIYSPVSGYLRPVEFDFVFGTACALHVVNPQQESIQSRLQGIRLARLLQDK